MPRRFTCASFWPRPRPKAPLHDPPGVGFCGWTCSRDWEGARRPFTAYISQGEGSAVLPLSSIRYLDSYADARYHVLQVTVEKRYSTGLTMGLAYTYGKSLGVGGDRNNGDPNYQNPRDSRNEMARYPFDVAHYVVINYVYEMPFLNRFKGVAGGFLGGWQPTASSRRGRASRSRPAAAT